MRSSISIQAHHLPLELCRPPELCRPELSRPPELCRPEPFQPNRCWVLNFRLPRQQLLIQVLSIRVLPIQA